MHVAILQKKTTGFLEAFTPLVEARGHAVTYFGLDDLVIDDRFTKFDLVILKSTKLYFVYAGWYAAEHGIRVVPDPEVAHCVSTRICYPFLARRAGIPTPKFYMGFPDALAAQLQPDQFPLVVKGIVGSASKGVHMLHGVADLPRAGPRFLYLEEYLEGQHLLVYFIQDQIRAFEKEPWVNEHHPVRPVAVTPAVRDAVRRWRAETGLRFGHLDFIRPSGTIAATRETGAVVLIDPGVFPQFTHWAEAPTLLCDLLLGQ